MDFKIDIKTLITIITLTIGIAGLYYNLESRIISLEAQMQNQSKQIQQLRKKQRIKK